MAMVIGQAFSVAYKEFLRATGISEEGLEQAEYAHILNAQTAPQAELDLLRDRDKIKKVWREREMVCVCVCVCVCLCVCVSVRVCVY